MKQLFVAIGFCIAFSLHAETPLRLSGSTTVKAALEPKHAALESAVGCQIEMSGTGTAAGLLSLTIGTAEVAMLSAPLEDVARGINEKTPGRVDPKQFHAEHIGDARTVFIVNPHNHARSLSFAQLGDILTGRITNWKDVGGADAPITVVSLGNGGPLLEHFLRGGSITSAAHTVANATQIPTIVAQDPNAIGIISAAHARGQTSLIQTDANIAAPLFLVTKGEPNGKVLKLVEAARALLGAPTDSVGMR